MDHITDLQQAVYNVLLTQIQFGTYRFGEPLPVMELASEQFLVSLDTVRAAYRRLKQQGYISLSKNVGAIVQVQYEKQEIDRHIQSFFAKRRHALIDLSESVEALFGRAQRFSLRHALPETLDDMERLTQTDILAPHAMLRYLKQQYAALGNGLLMRLVWQIYMFYQAPFFSMPGNIQQLHAPMYVPSVISACRRRDWAALQTITSRFQALMTESLRRYLDTEITALPPQAEIAFCWSSYRKPSQLRYSLAMELLIEINNGTYPAGTLLPTMTQLAELKGLSVSTVRRALALLHSIGAIQSTPKVGTRVVPFDQVSQNCDFTLPALRQRLLDTVQSLQFLALSCKEVARITLASLSTDELQQWKRQLCEIDNQQRYEVTSYVIIKLIVKFAPRQTLRLVYAELRRQFFWAHAFRSIKGRPEIVQALYKPCLAYFIECLERFDSLGFACRLEGLLLHELRFSVSYLLQQGVEEAKDILIPDEDET